MFSFAVRTFSNNYQLINCLWLIYKQFSLIEKHPVNNAETIIILYRSRNNQLISVQKRELESSNTLFMVHTVVQNDGLQM